MYQKVDAMEKKRFAGIPKTNDIEMVLFHRINTLFRIACLIFTIYIVNGWIHRYSLHKLSSVIDVKDFFKTDKDVSPAFSICVTDPKLNEKIVAFSTEFNESTYIKFLQGNLYFEELKKLNFDQIRFNWSDYLYEPPKAHLVSANGTSKGFVIAGSFWKFYTSYIGLQSHERYLTYCLAFEPLHQEVHAIRVRLNKTIFSNGKRPDYKLRVYHHYPHQIIRSYQHVKFLWDDVDERSNKMIFSARDIEVLDRFENSRSSCSKDWKNYDQVITEQHIREIGCRRPYQESKEVQNICSNQTAMAKCGLYPSNIKMKKFPEPCRTLEKANYKFLDSQTNKKELPKDAFEVEFFFNYRYKEIVQYEQIDLEVRITFNSC